MYGQPQTSPVVSCNPINDIRVETVGPPFKGNVVKIAEDGEILVKGENVMIGYWNNKEETDKVLKNGWLHTGDLGLIDELGRIIITGRKNHTESIVSDKMIIWGGANEFDVIGDGALYDMKSSNWINLKSPEFFSARMGHSANVYSDTIVIFWGGETGNGVLGGGAVYDAKS